MTKLTLSMTGRAVCRESGTHGSVRAVEGRPSMATLLKLSVFKEKGDF